MSFLISSLNLYRFPFTFVIFWDFAILEIIVGEVFFCNDVGNLSCICLTETPGSSHTNSNMRFLISSFSDQFAKYFFCCLIIFLNSLLARVISLVRMLCS